MGFIGIRAWLAESGGACIQGQSGPGSTKLSGDRRCKRSSSKRRSGVECRSWKGVNGRKFAVNLAGEGEGNLYGTIADKNKLRRSKDRIYDVREG